MFYALFTPPHPPLLMATSLGVSVASFCSVVSACWLSAAKQQQQQQHWTGGGTLLLHEGSSADAVVAVPLLSLSRGVSPPLLLSSGLCSKAVVRIRGARASPTQRGGVSLLALSLRLGESVHRGGVEEVVAPGGGP